MIVALIDSGIDLNQPALVSHLWTNSSEVSDGIDNDGNGFIDDIHGWDFVRNSADIRSRVSHGKEMSSLILKANPQSKIMVLKVFDYKTIEPSRIAKAIDYATANRANVINLSLTSHKNNVEITSAIQRALSKGIKVVAAAGNDGGKTLLFPANLPGVIPVAATQQDGKLQSWSNFQVGVPIVTVKEIRGTSHAAAFISGCISRIEKDKVSVSEIQKVCDGL